MPKISKSLGPAAFVAAFALTGTVSHAKDITISFVAAGMQAPYNVAVSKGFEEQATKLGAKVIILDGKFDTKIQGNAIADLIAQKVDGISLIPINSVVTQAFADDAAAAGISFASLAAQVGDPNKVPLRDVYKSVSYLIAPDDTLAAQSVAEYIATKLPKDRVVKIALAQGQAGLAVVKQRDDGFQAGLKKAGIKFEIVGAQPTDWSATQGQVICQNMLTAHPDADLIFAQYDDIASGCARAIAATGSHAVLVSASGGGNLGTKMLDSGELAAAICSSPKETGRKGAQALYDFATGKRTAKREFELANAPVITKENHAELCPEGW